MKARTGDKATIAAESYSSVKASTLTLNKCKLNLPVTSAFITTVILYTHGWLISSSPLIVCLPGRLALKLVLMELLIADAEAAGYAFCVNKWFTIGIII